MNLCELWPLFPVVARAQWMYLTCIDLTECYLSYCFSSIVNKPIVLVDIFSLSDQSLLTQEMVLHENPSKLTILKTQTSPSGTNDHATFKVRADVSFKNQKVTFTISGYLIVLHCSHVIDWVLDVLTQKWKGKPKKVENECICRYMSVVRILAYLKIAFLFGTADINL